MPTKSCSRRYLFLLFAQNLIGCQSTSTSSPTELPTRLLRVPECGVESYNSIEHELCGTVYRDQRSPACGIERYNRERSMACPNSIASSHYWTNWSENPRCNPDAQVGRECRTSHGEVGDTNCRLYCEIAEQAETCRLPEFGVERYHTCRHETHGLERYETCNRPEFGVAQYNECAVLLTREEAMEWIRNTRETMPILGQALITQYGNFFSFKGSQAGLACHISRWVDDPLFDGVTANLKIIYLAMFGQEYRTDATSCTQPAPQIASEDCQNDNNTPICLSVRGYNAARRWLTDRAVDAARLQDDIAARHDNGLHEEIRLTAASLEAITAPQ